MTPDSHKIEILGHIPGNFGQGAILRCSTMAITASKEGLQIVIADVNGERSIVVDPAELKLAVAVMCDDHPEATTRALAAVAAERERQRQLWVEETIPFNCDAEDIALGDKMAVLTEEVGEVATEVNQANCSLHPKVHLERLRVELIQVAAVAVAWAESLPTPSAPSAA